VDPELIVQRGNIVLKLNQKSGKISLNIMMNKNILEYIFLGGVVSSFLLGSCKEEQTLFKVLQPNESGIQFTNTVVESEQENILNYEYFYNGGGVASGDFNNDGLVDLYLTANQTDNKLYLNKGNLQFEDITEKSGTTGRKNAWKTGVSVVDINADGWLDIYVCYSGLRDSTLRKNQLFINNKNLNGSSPQFTEKASEYGLDDSGYSTQAAFFDYDLDGDLDCFLVNHNLAGYQRKEASVMRSAYDYNAGDKLFRNDGNEHFTDVSQQTGIKSNPLGFGLGVMISDMNQDGYPDIYVTNDYVEDDYLYINQRNGTFKDELRERIAHTSYSSMGVDVADINNDGLSDIFTLDMLPEDNARQKLLLWADNWNVYQAQLQNGFWHANMHNMLQINQGNGGFSEIGQLAGVSNTDWSWGTLLADFDMDGYKDIFVTNGIGRDYTNADFIKYYNDEEANGTKKPLLEHLKQMPTSQTKNYIFKNNKDLTFTNTQKQWGFDQPTVASGCVYVDLDNDGDFEIVTNNLNEPSRIYKNTQQEREAKNFVKIKLKGSTRNPFGIGAKITVKVNQNVQIQEVYPTHGFQSSSIGDLLFGLPDEVKKCDIEVKWMDGTKQILPNVSINQLLTIDYAKATPDNTIAANSPNGLLAATQSLDYQHIVPPTNNFDRQIMLPIQYSYSGPKMAVGDVNLDGIQDVFIGGTTEQTGGIIWGNKTTLLKLKSQQKHNNQDAIIQDFNGDKFPDLYIANGNYANAQFVEQNDELWLNDGKGNFKQAPLPEDQTNSLCVKTIDFDRDGDYDIFIGGHIKPNHFPFSEESFLLKNDGKAQFTKISLGDLGLVTGATVTDLDGDKFEEIMVVGEWMSPIVLKNKQGNLSPAVSNSTGSLKGWFNTIEKADIDGDGDDDFILGNLGTNTQVRANENEPASLIYDDFDQNGTTDFFMNYYIQGKSYPAYSRDEVAEQIPMLKKKFPDYKTFSEATIEQFFDGNIVEKANKKEITTLKTLILENNKGELLVHELPIQAQVAPVYAILAEDFNRDGKKDILLMGNNSKFRLRIGKVDANTGVMLLNTGNKFKFRPLSPQQSGIYVRGDVRSVKRAGKNIYVGVCEGKVQVFSNTDFSL
jgi:hypothetical protein